MELFLIFSRVLACKIAITAVKDFWRRTVRKKERSSLEPNSFFAKDFF
jgi:RNA processing factor Prp31